MSVSYVIIIPARGGSKRVPRKNIAPLGGKPLIEYTFVQVKESGCADNTYVSTDDSDIQSYAEASGMRVIERPKELAADGSSTEDVILHALEHLSLSGIEPEWVLTLPPTNPFRKATTINKFIGEMESVSNEYDCLMSVTETLGDYWKMKEHGELERLFPDAPRSQLERKGQGFALYEENSAIYCTRVAALKICSAEGAIAPILGNKVKGIALGSVESFDINTMDDQLIAEALAENFRK